MGALLISSVSCKDFLEEDPKGQFTTANFMNSVEEVDMAVCAIYSRVRWSQNCTDPVGMAWQGDDITTNPGSNKGKYANVDAFRPVNTDATVTAAWQQRYALIKACNYVINYIDEAPVDQKEKDIAKGQGLYWRAYSHFLLVREFGPIPLVTDLQPDYNQEPASIEEVYDRIVKDLTEAIRILPTDYRNSTSYSNPRSMYNANIYITQQAARATLCAVYMAMAGYPLNKGAEYYGYAAEQAKNVIEGVKSGEYEYVLMDEIGQVYSFVTPELNYNNETVVGINFTDTFGWSEPSSFALSYLFESLGGWGDAWGEYKFWKEYPEGKRKDTFYFQKFVKGNSEKDPQTGEYVLIDWWETEECHPMFTIYSMNSEEERRADGVFDCTKPVFGNERISSMRSRVIRYAEVLLWYAESQARADGAPNDLAYECINKVRNRAGLENLPAGLSGEEFAEAAMKEHGWEVAGNFCALVTRRSDQLRMNLLKDSFDYRRRNPTVEIEGLELKEPVTISGSWTVGETEYYPYPANDSSLDPNLRK